MSLPSQPTTIVSRHPRQSGFLYVEVLISILILAMIMAGVTPFLLTFIWTLKTGEANMEVAKIELASTYYASTHNGTFPLQLGQVQPLVSGAIVGQYQYSDNGSLTGLSYGALVWNPVRQAWVRR